MSKDHLIEVGEEIDIKPTTLHAELTAQVTTTYLQSSFLPLCQLATYQWTIKEGKKVCKWTIPLENLEKAEALLGKPIQFNPKYQEKIQNHMTMSTEQIDLPEFKGKSGHKIKETPDAYIITEWRKIETNEGEIQIKKINHTISKENINTVRQALNKIDENKFKNKTIPGRRLAEQIMKELGIERFNRIETKTFDAAKFYGSRSDYKKYFYYPLKVLEHLKELHHTKNGKIIKLQKYI